MILIQFDIKITFGKKLILYTLKVKPFLLPFYLGRVISKEVYVEDNPVEINLNINLHFDDNEDNENIDEPENGNSSGIFPELTSRSNCT